MPTPDAVDHRPTGIVRVRDRPLRRLSASGVPGLIQEAASWRSSSTRRRVPRQVRSEDEGQGLAEYALILALIAIVAIIALIFLGGQVSKILSTVGASV